jgi:hypothetical protein
VSFKNLTSYIKREYPSNTRRTGEINLQSYKALQKLELINIKRLRPPNLPLPTGINLGTQTLKKPRLTLQYIVSASTIPA